MKRFSSARSAGFTLIELLVVIAIIAILASVTIAGVSSALNAAKRTKANNTATQLQTAVMAYDTEYGVYPVPSTAATGADFYYASTNDNIDWKNLIICLSGNIDPTNGQTNAQSNVPNSRQIPFMTPKRTDLDTTGAGVLYNPMTSQGTNPPVTFNLVVDSDYDGVAGNSGQAANTLPNFAAWSTGAVQPAKLTGVTQGAAVWACCDTTAKVLPNNEGGSKLPNFWVHTY